jgi:DNA repair exonuclease SbcCD ATPase subunit
VRIGRLQLKDFRRYRDLDVNLAPGITVIRGPNEAGKTTIQRALELVLTRKVTSASGDVDTFRSWDAPEDSRPVISIEFVAEDEESTRTGTLEKAFRGSKGTVRLAVGDHVFTDPTQADQVLAELTGVPTEAFFRSTASVHHHEIADLARDESALRDRLQASISGADRGTSRAKKILDRAIRDLTTRGEKNPGRLKVAEDAVDKARAAVEAGEAALAQLERDRDALSAARERRAQVDRDLVERRALLEKARQAERVAAERATAQERYERYRQAVEVRDEITALNENHPSPDPLPVLRQAVERLRALDATIRELRALLSGEVEVQFEVPPEPTWRPLSRIALVLVAIGLLIAAATVGLQFADIADLGQAPAYLGGISAGIGFILAFVAWWLRRNDTMHRQLRDVEIDRRLRGRSQLEQELKSAEADTRVQLDAIGLEDLPAAEYLLGREEAHVQEIERLAAQLDGLVGKEPPETLPEIRDAAALEIAQKTSALEALGPIAKEPRARERLEVEVRDQELALDRARDDEANARARVEANAVDAEQVAGETERLATWRDQLAALQRRARVFEGTLRAIERAERATMRTATRYLEKRMVVDLERVTGGRYRRVKVDDRTLDIAVWAPERHDWVDVSQLSQGTLDLVYLTARIGLVRLVTGDRRPPLLFDDPFVTFDDLRARRAVELLRELASDFQVIYLTTSDRYDDVADQVVELPGPTDVDPGPTEDEPDAPATDRGRPGGRAEPAAPSPAGRR